jgi:hypothetical protein
MGRPELAHDPEFETTDDRLYGKNGDEIDDVI